MCACLCVCSCKVSLGGCLTVCVSCVCVRACAFTPVYTDLRASLRSVCVLSMYLFELWPWTHFQTAVSAPFMRCVCMCARVFHRLKSLPLTWSDLHMQETWCHVQMFPAVCSQRNVSATFHWYLISRFSRLHSVLTRVDAARSWVFSGSEVKWLQRKFAGHHMCLLFIKAGLFKPFHTEWVS